MTRWIAAVPTLLLAACASTASGSREPFPGGSPAAPQPEAAPVAGAAAAPAPPMAAPAASELSSAKAYAARFSRPDACEAAARAALPVSRAKAWEVLGACVQKGNFTPIRRLLDGTWDPELLAKPDAALVLASVIAARGGDVLGDLNLLRQRKIPIFGIEPATRNPELYQGRLVLLRARVDGMKTEKGKATVRLSEFALSGQVKFVEGDSRTAYRGSSRVEGRGEYQTDRYGSGRGRGEVNRSSESYRTTETRRSENTPQETGLIALGRLAKADPFFEPGRQFVVLGRFDGLREVPGEQEEEREAEKMPVLSIVGYVEPSAAIVE